MILILCGSYWNLWNQLCSTFCTHVNCSFLLLGHWIWQFITYIHNPTALMGLKAPRAKIKKRSVIPSQPDQLRKSALILLTCPSSVLTPTSVFDCLWWLLKAWQPCVSWSWRTTDHNSHQAAVSVLKSFTVGSVCNLDGCPVQGSLSLWAFTSSRVWEPLAFGGHTL